MHPFQHFRLRRPPFDAAPDPRVFCATPTHAEALATLEYAVYARKACTVLVGESGSGKTLLARMMAATASLQATVLWLHGLGQPETRTEMHVFARGTLSGAAPSRPPAVTTFPDWLRDESQRSASTVLIVDNADELPARGWRDVLTLLSREVIFSEPVRIGLFGCPILLRRLAIPAMISLRRRIFRTTVLQSLSRREICAYVQGRLAAAGGRLEDVFESEALDQIHRLTRGLPAAINQVCENAMLEAVSGGRQRVNAADVLTAAQALTGPLPPLHTVWKRVSLLNEPRLRALSFSSTRGSQAVRNLPAPAAGREQAGEPEQTGAPRAAATNSPLAPAVPISQQLQLLEYRLQNALSAMQRAARDSNSTLVRCTHSVPQGTASE